VNHVDTIVAAALAALRQAPAVTTGPIDEEIDVRALAEEVTEAISVSVPVSDPQNAGAIFGHPVDWVSTLQVEAYARQDSAAAGTGRASRALQARVYARLMADPTLGGAAADVRAPTLNTEGAALDTRMGCCTGSYPVLHRTQARTLDASA
jgi:hypothetical protein